jgi:hypothetical protein
MGSPEGSEFTADFRDLLFAFVHAKVRFLVIGAYAVAVHGRPRATKDLDVWVDATPANAKRVMRALIDFGAPLAGLREKDLSKPGYGFQMGLPPNRIDVLTVVSGLRFLDAWKRRTSAKFGDVSCNVVALDDLIANKRAAGRLQDLADAAALERLKRARAKRKLSDR